MTDAEIMEFMEDNFIGVAFALVPGWVVRSEEGHVMATAGAHEGIRVAIERAARQLRDHPALFRRISYPNSDPLRNL